MTESNRTKRRAIRFNPDRLACALVMYRADGVPFEADDLGLIIDEAGKGAQIVLKKHPQITLGLRVMVQLGKLAPLPATIIWIKDVDADLRRVGLEYVE